MRTRIILFVTVLIVAGLSAAAPPAAQHAAPPKPAADQISDDSLGISPDSADDVQSQDPHRGRVESTVFRRERPVIYHPSGRDPFRALIVDEKKPEVIETDLLIVDGATLTGVVWAEGRYLAMVKDKNGKSFFLHEGDPVYQGRVTLVTQNQANFDISDFGDYQKITLRVQVKDTDKGKG